MTKLCCQTYEVLDLPWIHIVGAASGEIAKAEKQTIERGANKDISEYGSSSLKFKPLEKLRSHVSLGSGPNNRPSVPKKTIRSKLARLKNCS